MNLNKWSALLFAAALVLSLLAGCGQDNLPQTPPVPDPAPAVDEKDDPPSIPEPLPDPVETIPEDEAPPESVPSDGDSQDNQGGTLQAPDSSTVPAEVSPDEPEDKPEPAPAAPPAEPSPAPEPEGEGETVMAGDTYTISVMLEGGSGRATVESPAKLRYEGGTCWATIVWSSPYFDYMVVDGQRYDPINTEGNSTFEIPVSAFDQPLAVIADTIAMSEPHEIEYMMTFDSASMQDA